MRGQLMQASRTLLPTPTPTPMVLEAYIDERGLAQVRSATPRAETEAEANGADVRLSAAERFEQLGRSKAASTQGLAKPTKRLEKTDATDVVEAVADQVAELEAVIAAQQGPGDYA